MSPRKCHRTSRSRKFRGQHHPNVFARVRRNRLAQLVLQFGLFGFHQHHARSWRIMPNPHAGGGKRLRFRVLAHWLGKILHGAGYRANLFRRHCARPVNHHRTLRRVQHGRLNSMLGRARIHNCVNAPIQIVQHMRRRCWTGIAEQVRARCSHRHACRANQRKRYRMRRHAHAH